MSYHIVTNSKLAAALAAVGVPLVSPGITKARFRKGQSPKVKVAFYFATTTLDGNTSTFELAKAWGNPAKFENRPAPLCYMGAFRAALENRESLVGAAHEFMRSQDRGALEEFEPKLLNEARTNPKVVEFVLVPRGKVHILARSTATPQQLEELTEIADTVSKKI